MDVPPLIIPVAPLFLKNIQRLLHISLASLGPNPPMTALNRNLRNRLQILGLLILKRTVPLKLAMVRERAPAIMPALFQLKASQALKDLVKSKYKKTTHCWAVFFIFLLWYNVISLF